MHDLGVLDFEVCDLQAVTCLLGSPFLGAPERDTLLSWGSVKFLSIVLNGKRERLPLTVLDGSRPDLTCDIEADQQDPILLMVQPFLDGKEALVEPGILATEKLSLTKEQQVRLQELLDKYPDVFSSNWDTPDGLPPERWPGNHCDLELRDGEHNLPSQKPIPLSDSMREEARKLIEELVAKRLLEPITAADFASPIFLVGKFNEKGEHSGWRLVVDYRW